MNNNVENSVEETFDDMLDSVKSINDDFINSYFEDDKIDSIVKENKEESDIYNEDSLKELSNELNDELFNPVEKNVENIVQEEQHEEKKSLEEENVLELIDQTTSSEEFFDILEGKKND